MANLPALSPIAPRRVPMQSIEWQRIIAEANYRTKEVAARSGYSVRTLQRFVKEQFSMPLGQLLVQCRMQKAVELLQSGKSVKEVSFTLGFKKPSHFSRTYRRQFGVSPNESRRRKELNSCETLTDSKEFDSAATVGGALGYPQASESKGSWSSAPESSG